MNAAAEQLACLLIMGKTDRPQRARRTRRRHGIRWKRHFRKLISNLSFGFLLVGCAQPLPFARTSGSDPVHVLASSDVPNERIAAYRRLGAETDAGYGRPESVATLLADGMRKESAPLARAAAARSLGRYDAPVAREALIEALADKSPMVRAEAALSLGAIAKRDAVDRLGELARSDSDLDVRLAATQALVAIGDASCNSHLVQCLLDRDVVVVETAGRGLRESTGADLASTFDAWERYVATGHVPADAPRVADQSGSAPILGFFR